MNTKSELDSTNSITIETSAICPKCGATNEGDSKFCASCGIELSTSYKSPIGSPAFEQIKEQKLPKKVVKYVEPNTVFAEGLPEWSIEPPQVIVRRR